MPIYVRVLIFAFGLVFMLGSLRALIRGFKSGEMKVFWDVTNNGRFEVIKRENMPFLFWIYAFGNIIGAVTGLSLMVGGITGVYLQQ